MSNRIQRLNALIKMEMSQILLRDLDFPNDVLITITRVETAPNLSQVRIYISVMLARQNFPKENLGGPKDQTDKVFKILDRTIYDIQQKLNKRLKMRPVPRVKFEREKMTKEAGRVEDILEQLKKEEK